MGGNTSTVPCFINSIGVNNHMNWSGYVYDNPSLVISEMNYMGINHIRDMLFSDISDFGEVAEAGNVFDNGFLNSDEDVATQLPGFLSTVNQFAINYPGSVVAFEGPNELNCQEALYSGVSTITSAATAVAAQLDIYTSVKADSTLAGVPVMNSSLSLSCTSLGSTAGYIAAEGNMDAEVNLANVHIYSVTSPPLSTFLSSTLGIPVAQPNAPGKPVAITEFGFSTPEWVSTKVAAQYTIFGLADAYKEGRS